MATTDLAESGRPGEGATAATTMCEAFQQTVAAHTDVVALRTLGGGAGITWAEYGERVRRIAAGLHDLGVRRGDTLALMLTNRPEFHLVDVAAMHLGAVPFSIYNTSAPEQVEFVLRDSGARVAFVEEAFADRVSVPEIVTVEQLEALEARGARSALDFDAAWQR